MNEDIVSPLRSIHIFDDRDDLISPITLNYESEIDHIESLYRAASPDTDQRQESSPSDVNGDTNESRNEDRHGGSDLGREDGIQNVNTTSDISHHEPILPLRIRPKRPVVTTESTNQAGDLHIGATINSPLSPFTSLKVLPSLRMIMGTLHQLLLMACFRISIPTNVDLGAR